MRILYMTLQHEHDVVLARQRARQVAALLGCEAQDQTRIGTAVSEIARNAVSYAGGGKVEFFVEGDTLPQLLQICISDQGPGIPALPAILAGQYHSNTGMGLGIVGARRLMDQFDIVSTPGQGTTVWLKKLFPGRAPLITAPRLTKLVDELTQLRPHDPLAEIQQQNQELLRRWRSYTSGKRNWSASTTSWKTRIVAWWHSMPSWMKKLIICGALMNSRPAFSPT